MRNAFADEITELAKTRDDLVLLSGDIGNRLFDRFKAVAPQRFYNCGVAEANMVGLAAGMAMGGLRPVCYTITPFVTYRAMEQIRVDLGYHHTRVIVVGTGAGLSYASLGATHHSCEEMGMLRLIPGLTVLAPADAMEVRGCLRAALELGGPVYIRIGKKGEPVVHSEVPLVRPGRFLPVREGSGVLLLVAGTLLPEALLAAEHLAARGLSAAVVSAVSVKPLDTEFLQHAFHRHGLVATIEEHSVLGGLGGSVAEWLTDQPRRQQMARLVRFGCPDEFLHETTHQKSAREKFGLLGPQIAERIAQTVHLQIDITA